MRRLIAIAPILLAAGCASLEPPDDWSKADTSRQIAYSAILAADATTTSRITEKNGLVEGSPIARIFIGDRPEPTKTYVAAALLGFGHYWLARRMKPKQRRLLQWLTISGHSLAVRQNCDNQLC